MDAWLQQNPSSNMRNLAVYLDTTYCDAAYDFPKQQLAIDAVVQCVQYEQRKAPGALFVFGAYGIGKERVFMSVAEATGMRVYVDKNRWRGMMCFDWLPEEHARLTTDPTASHLWVVPMGQVNFNHLNALRQKKPTCSRVVAFQPTGWTHPGKDAGGNKGAKYRSNEGAADAAAAVTAGLSPLLKPRSKDGNTIYAVPYSEHSSFGELVEFIKTFR
jgi:DNA cross-link repair 1A protein